MVEVLISTLVLGIAIAGLTGTFTSSQRGMVAIRSRSSAKEIAGQRIERLATQMASDLPACDGPASCRSTSGELADDQASAGAFQCTQYVDDMELPDPTQATGRYGRYRIDTSVAAHPDPRQPDAKVVTVSVCFANQTGQIEEVQARRTIVPGV